MQTFIDRYIEQGLQEGLQQGQQKARVDLLLRQMTRKFGTLSTNQQLRINRADEASLLRWAEQVLFAETPDEALR